MGHEPRHETYSKVRPSTQLCNVISVMNTALSASRWKVTALPLVPSMIFQLVNSPEWEKTDTSSIETSGSAAAFLSPELSEKFRSKVKTTLFHGYGSSEAVRVPFSSSAILERFTRRWFHTDPLDCYNNAR